MYFFMADIASKQSFNQLALIIQFWVGIFLSQLILCLWDNTRFVLGVQNCTCKCLNAKMWSEFNIFKLA